MQSQNPSLISWREWDQEAFALARSLDMPILLSISAVWCHWCHVMDQTTFADPEVAALVDAHFVPIRVDNDKRPDVNARYNMGGWPTVAFLTPDGEIISGGTYIPPDAFRQTLRRILEYYHQNKAEIQTRTAQMQAQRRRAWELALQDNGELTPGMGDRVYELVAGAYDPQYGGFGQAPKFPQPEILEWLLARHWYTVHTLPADASTSASSPYSGPLEMAVKTLRAMALGGMYDQEAGGFFRYSTTRDWSIPHFEKMLEDNARLLSVYLAAYQVTGEALFRHTAEGILSYVETTLRDPDLGHFYGSQDADESYYALNKAERDQRRAPFIDKVAYTSWNAMMAAAYLEAAAILQRPELATSAITTLRFLWQNCWQSDQGLAHFWDGQPHVFGLLNDQVWTAYASLHAYEYTGEQEHLQRAQATMRWTHSALSTAAGHFRDRPEHGTALGRLAEAETPLPDNAVAARVLTRLARLSGDDLYKQWAQAALAAFAGLYERYGTFAAGYAMAVETLSKEPLLLVVVGSPQDIGTGALLRAAWRAYTPNRAFLIIDPAAEAERLAALGYPAEPSPRAYACFGRTCAEPVADASQVTLTIESLLKRTT